MDTTKDFLYKVVQKNPYYDSTRFETLEAATNNARASAYEEGKPYLIMKAIAEAEAPEAVNNVKVTELS